MMGKISFTLVYVDDMLITDSKSLIDGIKASS
jgi:hypothetical protein